jgi:ribosomal protein S18 acetylase RimI-like enzyme
MTSPLRQLIPDDADAFLAFRIEALERHPQAFASGDDDARSATPERVRALLDRPGSAVLVAESGGQMLGMVGVRRETGIKTQHKATLWGLYVQADQRRVGLGRQLVQGAVAFAWTQPGLDYLRLTVDHDSAAAQLFAKLGFTIFGLEAGALCLPAGTKVDRAYMRLDLDRPFDEFIGAAPLNEDVVTFWRKLRGTEDEA